MNPALLRQWSPPTRLGTRVNLASFLQKANTELIPGGRAKGRPDSDFDPEQLAAGIKVELEHTKDVNLAKEICKDHLAEDKDYYRKLKKMESGEAYQVKKGLVMLEEMSKAAENQRIGVPGGPNIFPSAAPFKRAGEEVPGAWKDFHSTSPASPGPLKPATMVNAPVGPSSKESVVSNAPKVKKPRKSKAPGSEGPKPPEPPKTAGSEGPKPPETPKTGEPPKAPGSPETTEPGEGEEKLTQKPEKVQLHGVGPAYGEGFAAGSLIGQEAGGAPTGGTTPVTIGSQFGLMKLQEAGQGGVSGGRGSPGYFPRMSVGRGPAIGSTKRVSGEVSQAAMQRSISPFTRPGSRTYIGRK